METYRARFTPLTAPITRVQCFKACVAESKTSVLQLPAGCNTIKLRNHWLWNYPFVMGGGGGNCEEGSVNLRNNSMDEQSRHNRVKCTGVPYRISQWMLYIVERLLVEKPYAGLWLIVIARPRGTLATSRNTELNSNSLDLNQSPCYTTTRVVFSNRLMVHECHSHTS